MGPTSRNRLQAPGSIWLEARGSRLNFRAFSLQPSAKQGRVVAVNVSEKKGTRKKNVGQCELLADLGLEGDAHAGNGKRQVSLLAEESIDKMRELGLDVSSGDFAENITTRGFDLTSLPIGARLKIGEEALLELTQIGKVCHSRCAIYYQAGDCVMPKEGIFCQVLRSGQIKTGDAIAGASKSKQR